MRKPVSTRGLRGRYDSGVGIGSSSNSSGRSRSRSRRLVMRSPSQVLRARISHPALGRLPAQEQPDGGLDERGHDSKSHNDLVNYPS